MPRTGRTGLSAARKSELWIRWKNGESLSDIGRALGKHAASVFTVVIVKSGIAPAIRHRRLGSLSKLEREEISLGLCVGYSQHRIGYNLGRSASTVSREVRRNGGRVHTVLSKPKTAHTAVCTSSQALFSLENIL